VARASARARGIAGVRMLREATRGGLEEGVGLCQESEEALAPIPVVTVFLEPLGSCVMFGTPLYFPPYLLKSTVAPLNIPHVAIMSLPLEDIPHSSYALLNIVLKTAC
jgi:hypothetical protein